jgi:hypothetical protein
MSIKLLLFSTLVYLSGLVIMDDFKKNIPVLTSNLTEPTGLLVNSSYSNSGTF